MKLVRVISREEYDSPEQACQVAINEYKTIVRHRPCVPSEITTFWEGGKITLHVYASPVPGFEREE